MSWQDLNNDDLRKTSYREHKRTRIVRTPGPAKIIADKRQIKGSKVVIIRMPEDLHARGRSRVIGSLNAAINAIFEEALDRHEASGQQWTVEEE